MVEAVIIKNKIENAFGNNPTANVQPNPASDPYKSEQNEDGEDTDENSSFSPNPSGDESPGEPPEEPEKKKKLKAKERKALEKKTASEKRWYSSFKPSSK